MRAEQYLQQHKKVKGNEIGVWHIDDLVDEPLAVCSSSAIIVTLPGGNINLYSGPSAQGSGVGSAEGNKRREKK